MRAMFGAIRILTIQKHVVLLFTVRTIARKQIAIGLVLTAPRSGRFILPTRVFAAKQSRNRTLTPRTTRKIVGMTPTLILV